MIALIVVSWKVKKSKLYNYSLDEHPAQKNQNLKIKRLKTKFRSNFSDVTFSFKDDENRNFVFAWKKNFILQLNNFKYRLTDKFFHST